VEITVFGLNMKSDLPNHSRKRFRMTHRQKVNTDLIEDLARQTAVPIALVKELYEDEVTKLKADATVENYIGVIAGQRVKRKLRSRRRAVA
jgi:hypothetical protein